MRKNLDNSSVRQVDLQRPELGQTNESRTDALAHDLPKWDVVRTDALRVLATTHCKVKAIHTDGKLSIGDVVMASKTSVWLADIKTWEILADGKRRLVDAGVFLNNVSLTKRYDLKDFRSIEPLEQDSSS